MVPLPKPLTGLVQTALAVLPLLLCTAADAFMVSITPGVKSIFLVVGTGTVTGGALSEGGVPKNNSTINRVTLVVPAASLGDGPLPMVTNSTVANSYWDNFPFCTVPTQVYIGAFFRTPGGKAAATLSVSTPSQLTSGVDTLPFSTISWVSSGDKEATSAIPSGSFTGNQSLLKIAANTWVESCLAFSYSNNSLVKAGTFTGTATYTLTAP